MELIHILKQGSTENIIDEPIGFDAFEMKLSRGDYHGISAEVSTGNLEFYGLAYIIIKSAYRADIDTDLQYLVRTYDGRDIYTGNIDLSTCSFVSGEYESVSCKVGEIGVKTTFNNRAETEIDLQTDLQMDGERMPVPPFLEIGIPSKHILYTNESTQKAAKDISTIAGAYSDDVKYYFVMDDVLVNEFGTLNQGSLFIEDADFNTKFGNNTKMRIVADVECEVKTLNITHQGSGTLPDIQYAGLRLETNTGASLAYQQITDVAVGKTIHLQCDLSDIATDTGLRICFLYRRNSYTIRSWQFVVTIKKATIKMQMFDNLQDATTNAKMLPINDALCIITHAITDGAMTCKSDWYGRINSFFNPTAEMGGGALKAITNGYNIRGVNPADLGSEEARNMPVSFKQMIQALNALDCIGWGFSQENGKPCVRVERWDWFYKPQVLVSFTNIPDVTRQVATNSIITSLVIGFKKYYTSSELNSIDSIHAERTFTSEIKAVKKEVTATCDWIADNYAIEETRRAATDVSATEEFKYDENIFVFELMAVQPMGAPVASYYIGHTAPEASISGINKPSELLNAKISPRHCAARWKDYLFRAFNAKDMKMTAGKVNYKAAFTTIAPIVVGNNRLVHSLHTMQDGGATGMQAEDAPILYNHAIMDAEEIRFEAPVSIEQYKIIKANPYGLISVNGKQGWIKEFSFNFHDSIGNFTLISKHE